MSRSVTLAGLAVDLDDCDVASERERPHRVEVELVRRVGAAVVASRPSAISAHETPARGHAGDAEPTVVEHDDVVGRGLEHSAARRARPFEHDLGRSWTALPASCSDREPNVPTPWATSAVSECTTRTSSNGTPEHRRRDLRPRGLVALAVRHAAGDDRDGAVVVRPRPIRTRRRARTSRRSKPIPIPSWRSVGSRADARLLGAQRRRSRYREAPRRARPRSRRCRTSRRSAWCTGTRSGGMKLRRRRSPDRGRARAASDVERPLHQRGRFGSARAAVRTRRRGVREHADVRSNSIVGIAYTPDAIMRVTIGMNVPRIGYAPTSA